MDEQGVNQGTFVACLAWIKPGFAAKIPVEADMTEQQIQQLKADPQIAGQMAEMNGNIQQDYEGQYPNFAQSIAMAGQSSSKYPTVVQDLSDQDQQDYYIKDTDALIAAGKIEKQYSSIEIYIYQQDKNNLFVHHEIMLNSFPLSMQWLNVSLGSVGGNKPQKGNYAIVSTFLPQIEIWNLDSSEAVQPDLVLGGQAISKKKPKKFTNTNKKFKEGSHTDSVLSISLNQKFNNVLASGSIDTTVKVWDLQKAANVFTCNHHKAKVNKVQWNPNDPSILFSNSQEKKMAILDSRYPDDRIWINTPTKQNVESACWNVNNVSQIVYVTDQGNLYMVDARNPKQNILSQNIHGKSEVTDVACSLKNLCYTCSEDQSVKIWNLNDMSNPMAFKKPKCGKNFCLEVMQTKEGPVISVGNAKGQLFIWQICENEHIEAYWKS